MVVIKLMGGLGNQMFQFAFALNYILQGKEVRFDTSFYQQSKAHNGFELDKVFNIYMPVAVNRDIFYFVEKNNKTGTNQEFKLKPGRSIIRENKEMEYFYFKELAIMDDVYFSGYWQNENYFHKNKKQLVPYFKFPEINRKDSGNYHLQMEIVHTNSVSVHLRRGDYLHSPMHCNLSIEYYKQAIELLKKQINGALTFYIFSDDINWAKNNFHEKNMVFVNLNTGRNSFRDMQLMSICKHNIIANSTFSWWGAWLNQNNLKMVIMPEHWLNKEINMKGLKHKSWIKI